MRPAVFLGTSTLALALAVAACGKTGASAAASAAADVDAGPAFSLTPPPGFSPVKPTPPLVAAWEAAQLKNGFTPTLNVLVEPRPPGSTSDAYHTWKQGLLFGLEKQYADVKLLAERELVAGPRRARLAIVLVQLPVPSGGQPMPLFAYGAMFDVGDQLYTVGALTGASLDAATTEVKPIGEAEILAALASFRAR
jgi:hypothetical protein